MTELRGSYTVAITPMTKEEEVDLEALKRNLDWYISEGVPGVCVLGGTGEFSSLTKEERILIAEESIKHIDGRVKCIIGTAAETTEDTLFYTKHAESIGADGVMIINPYYCLPTEDELYEHFKVVSDNTNIPIMIYNNPGNSGVDMTPDVIARIAKLKNVDYVKDASGELKRVTQIQRETNGEIKIFCGGEDLALENFILGATGWICVCSNIIPKEATELFDLVDSGRVDEAKVLFERLYPLLNMLENGGKPVQRVKKALELMGRDSGPARAPRGPLTKEEEAELVEVLKTLNLI